MLSIGNGLPYHRARVGGPDVGTCLIYRRGSGGRSAEIRATITVGWPRAPLDGCTDAAVETWP